MSLFEKRFLSHKLPEMQKEVEVGRAVERQNNKIEISKQRAIVSELGEIKLNNLKKIPNNPESKIEVYLDRLENIFLHSSEKVRERNLKIISPALYDEFIIKPNEVPESYFELQKRIARERGEAVEYIPDTVRQQMIETIIKDQESSLNEWLKYLSSGDAVYPTWFKYFALRNILKLSQFDKEHGHFKKRTATTVAPFPDIYHEALARVADEYLKILENDPKKIKDPEQKAVIDAKFADLYAKEIQSTLQEGLESREGTAGEWVKYNQQSRENENGYYDDDGEWVTVPDQGNMEKENVNLSQADLLYKSLEGKGTGWCTAGHSTAQHQLAQGDFYVYYTYDIAGKASNPRIAIRMDGEQIAEVRGVLHGQELEPQLQEILDEKLVEFGATADRYRKTSVDMRSLTIIDKKVKNGEEISNEEARFLFEFKDSIEGFGYQKDPRIYELQEKIFSIDLVRRLYLESHRESVDVEEFNRMEKSTSKKNNPFAEFFGVESDNREVMSSIEEKTDSKNLTQAQITWVIDNAPIGFFTRIFKDEEFKSSLLEDSEKRDWSLLLLIDKEQKSLYKNILASAINIDEKVALSLLEKKEISTVVDNLDKFQLDHLTHDMIATDAINNGESRLVLNNLDKFQLDHLTHDMIATDAINNGESRLVLNNLDKFTFVDKFKDVSRRSMEEYWLKDGFDNEKEGNFLGEYSKRDKLANLGLLYKENEIVGIRTEDEFRRNFLEPSFSRITENIRKKVTYQSLAWDRDAFINGLKQLEEISDQLYYDIVLFDQKNIESRSHKMLSYHGNQNAKEVFKKISSFSVETLRKCIKELELDSAIYSIDRYLDVNPGTSATDLLEQILEESVKAEKTVRIIRNYLDSTFKEIPNDEIVNKILDRDIKSVKYICDYGPKKFKKLSENTFLRLMRNGMDIRPYSDSYIESFEKLGEDTALKILESGNKLHDFPTHYYNLSEKTAWALLRTGEFWQMTKVIENPDQFRDFRLNDETIQKIITLGGERYLINRGLIK